MLRITVFIVLIMALGQVVMTGRYSSTIYADTKANMIREVQPPPVVDTTTAQTAVSAFTTTTTAEDETHKTTTTPRIMAASLRKIPLKDRVTSHWCHSRDLLKDSGQRATCLFHHLCVVPRKQKDHHNPREVDFLYVTPNNNDAHHHAVNIAEEASFTLGIGPHSWDAKMMFAPKAVTQSELETQYPHRQYVGGTSTLFYEYNAENFGHMLTDVLMPVYVALESFGLLDQDVKMYRYSIMDAIGWSCDFHRRLNQTYYGNVGAHCDRFYGMMSELMRGHQPLRVLNARPSSRRALKRSLWAWPCTRMIVWRDLLDATRISGLSAIWLGNDNFGSSAITCSPMSEFHWSRRRGTKLPLPFGRIRVGH